MKLNLNTVLPPLTALSLYLGVSAQANILPPNDLHLEDQILLDANINEEAFNKIIDSVSVHFEKVVALHGGKLNMNKKWTDSTVNASANQEGTTWHVNMYGGLARRQEITPDGFALVVCHELGHHLGGYPFYSGRFTWAASEGQADYYATQVCARKIWANDYVENAKARDTVVAAAKEKCDQNWSSVEAQNLCYRISDAGMSLARLFAGLRTGTPEPKFDTPDPSKVSQTNTAHPQSQCRLDTYFNGSLCSVRSDVTVIPGKNHPAGQGSQDAEREAAFLSCNQKDGFDMGFRPRCWFKPLLGQSDPSI